MPTSISIGFSQNPDPTNAILQACVHVKNQLDTPDTDLVLIFASPQYIIPEMQSVIARTLRPRKLVGSSTGGIILSNGVANRGIAVVGINSDTMNFGIAAIRDIGSQDMHYTGFDLARKATQDLNNTHREAFIVFSEGIEKNATPFLKGVREVLGVGFPILGIISSDDFKYQKLFQLYQDQVLQNTAVGLLLGGSLQLAFGCTHSFKPLGKPRTVTKVDGYVLRTIDDRPAVEIYRHFLGDDANDLKNFAMNSYAAMYPLGFYLEGSNEYLLRNIIDILEDGSIVCHEGVPLGAEVHLMISDKESCRASAVQAAEIVKESLADKQAKLVLVFESLARQKVLGPAVINQIESIRDILGTSTPIVGMCGYGEIGPFKSLDNIKNIHLHNENILIIALA